MSVAAITNQPTKFIQDPQEVLDYTCLLDAEGDTVSSASWSVPSPLVNLAELITSTTAVVRIGASSGEVGETYRIVVHIVGASGQEYEMSIWIRVQQR